MNLVKEQKEKIVLVAFVILMTGILCFNNPHIKKNNTLLYENAKFYGFNVNDSIILDKIKPDQDHEIYVNLEEAKFWGIKIGSIPN